MQLSFAHMSDPHLPLPPGGPPLRLLLNKRLLGYLSWHRRRRREHRREVLAALAEDIAAARPDHLLVGGDLVHIALPREFTAARSWLEGLGQPADVTMVPGNHDRYVTMPWAQGPGQWQPWMQGDDDEDTGFPFVRRRGPVAFICLSTAVPTPPFLATGALGAEQPARAEALLKDLARQGAFRTVVLHHPPEDRPTTRRKALTDRARLQQVLARTGAELVLHGHQHQSRFGTLAGPRGPIPVVGVPSASMNEAEKAEPARWHLFRVQRGAGGWRLSATVRALARGRFRTLGRWHLNISG